MKSSARVQFVISLIIVVTIGVTQIAFSQIDDFTIEGVGHFGGNVSCGAVQGNYAYMGQGPYLTVLDLSVDPPVQAAFLELADQSYDLTIEDNFCFIYLQNTGGLQIIDIQDPTTPVIVGTLPLGNNETGGGIDVSGNRAFVAAAYDGLQVIDVSDHTAPTIIGNAAGYVSEVFIVGDKAYTTGGGLKIYDVTDPTPVELGALAINGSKSVFANQTHAYVAAGFMTTNTHIIDITTPQNPQEVGIFVSNVNGAGHRPNSVFVENGTAYIGCREYVFSVDVTDPALPTELNKLKTGGSVVAIQSEGDNLHAIIRAGASPYQKINKSDPTALSKITSYDSPWDVKFLLNDSDRLYVASVEALWIYDITVQAQPTLTAHYTQWPNFLQLAIEDDQLFARSDTDVKILNIADPLNVAATGTYTPGAGNPKQIVVANNFLYVTVENGQSFLDIVDVSDPANPASVGQMDFPGNANDLFVQGYTSLAGVLYDDGAGDRGCQFIDVSTPTAPVVTGFFQTEGTPSSIWIEQTTAFIASNDNGYTLEAVDLTDPSNPDKLSETTGTGIMHDVEVQGGFVFTGVQGGSVHVIVWNPITGFGMLEICPSPSTVDITTTNPNLNGSSANGAVYTNEGERNGNEVSGDKGVVIQSYSIFGYSENLTLTLSPGPLNPGYSMHCPAQDANDKTNTPVIQATLTASPEADWIFTGITFAVQGNVSAEHVKMTKLRFGGAQGVVMDSAKYGQTVNFRIPPPYNKITAGSSITMMVTFDFTEKKAEQFDEVIQFTAYTNRTFIGARPEDDRLGVILPLIPPIVPFFGGPTIVGCVHNVTVNKAFGGIVEAVNAPETLDNHTLKVCPGEYVENVTVSKSLVISSYLGADLTNVKAAVAENHVFQLTKQNSTIEGFTIEAASGSGKAGVYASTTTQSTQHRTSAFTTLLKNGQKIQNNKFYDNYYGVHLNGVGNYLIKNNFFMDNKAHGLYLQSSNYNQVENNSLTNNDSSGVFMSGLNETGTTEKSFKTNSIRKNGQHGVYLSNCQGTVLEDQVAVDENKIHGIFAVGCQQIQINKNLSIDKNENDGLRLDNCSNVIISENKIEHNLEHGISVMNSSAQGDQSIEIKGNTILGFRRENWQQIGIYLEKSSGVKIGHQESKNTINSHKKYGVYIHDGSDNTEITGNTIQYNDSAGVYIKATKGNQIFGENTIGPENGQGIHLLNCVDVNEVIDATVEGNVENGILLEKSKKSKIGTTNNRNTIKSNKANGVSLVKCVCAGGGDENLIAGNVATENDSAGISLRRSDHNTIHNDNQTNKNKLYGIHLIDSEDNLIESNKIEENEGDGIHIQGSATNTVQKNEIKSNEADGIYLFYCNKLGNTFIDINENTIQENNNGICIDNSEGVKVWSGNPAIATKRNTISSNDSCGIQLINSSCDTTEENFIGSNIIENNDFGVFVENSYENIIGSKDDANIIKGSKKAGVYLLKSRKITIAHNDITPKNKTGIVLKECDCSSKSQNQIFGNRITDSEQYGIMLENSTGNLIGKETEDKNLIISNEYGGVYLKDCLTQQDGTRNTIQNNQIRNNSPESANGVWLVNSSYTNITKNWITHNAKDGVNLEKSNYNDIYVNHAISDNDRHGINIQHSTQNRVWSNDVKRNGENGIELDFSRENHLPPKGWNQQFNTIEENTKHGIYLHRSHYNIFSFNKVIGNKENGVTFFVSLGNEMLGPQLITGNTGHGVEFKSANENKLFAPKHQFIYPDVLEGIISHNGKNGVHMDFGTKNKVEYYYVHHNEVGFNFQNSGGNRAYKCLFYHNDTGAKGHDAERNKLVGCNPKYSLKKLTGIFLDNSSMEIVGCTIGTNVGDGIKLTNGSTALITKSNIYENEDLGINNVDPSVVIDATNNWWGSPDGPGGIGPGSGDEIAGNVDFTGWRTDSVSTLVYTEDDTVFIGKGLTDSVLCLFMGLPDDVLDVTVTDSLGWITTPGQFTHNLADTLDASIGVTVPDEADVGAINKVKVAIVSQTDATLADADSFYVVAYDKFPVKIDVDPDSVVLRTGGNTIFTAQVLDSTDQEVNANIIWSAGGGIITQAGEYTAGQTIGEFWVTAQEAITQIKDSAFVKILTPLARLQISPDDVELQSGESMQFTVVGYDEENNEVDLHAKWSTNGGTVDQVGFFTAGPDTGEFQVMVQDTLSDLTDLATITITPGTSVKSAQNTILPDQFSLGQNYPNPFNPETLIPFSVMEQCHVCLVVYDIRGREVKRLVDEVRQPGLYTARFDSGKLPTGIYIYSIRMKDFSDVKKMLLMQ